MIRIEYILLQNDAAFPAEQEFSALFMPGFWKDENKISVDSDASVQFDQPGKWNYLDIELLDDDRITQATFRIDVFRESNYPRSAMFTDADIESLVREYRQGRFNGSAEIKNIAGWCFTSFMLETEDPRMRKEFIQSVDRFLKAAGGIVVYPELMNPETFRSFHSLVQDVPEPEIEPENDDYLSN